MAGSGGYDIVAGIDECFPNLVEGVLPSQIPCKLFYRGDIGLIRDIQNNVAVIGTLSPTQDIIERERRIVERLSEKKRTIVSGLARGCDTVAHEAALLFGTKTIAILPSTLDRIYPRSNERLAEKIVSNGGLVVSEYCEEARSRGETIKRFIERDRLQAMFSFAIILIASHARGEGDSGSRHAMDKAKAYGRMRFVMYDQSSDKKRTDFGLNRDLYEKGVSVVTTKTLDCL